jgi:hypothetical protein
MSHRSSAILSRLSLFAALPLGVIAGSASGGLKWNTVVAPGGFAQACAGPQTCGCGGWPGDDWTIYFGSGVVIEEHSFAGSSSASADAAYSGGSTSNSCSGTAGMGYFKAHSSNNAPNNTFFPAAVANGGWSELFTVDSPGLSGQAGFMQFTLDVSGELFASGFAGSAAFSVTGYKDTGQLTINSLFDPGGSDLLGTDRQYGNWAIATYGSTDQKSVNDTVTFAVPITFGTQFKLGIYANSRAGMRSSSGVQGNSTADSNFDMGLTWGGVVAVYHGLTPIAEYTITSATGTDWDGPVSPFSPADFNQDGVVDGADLGFLLAAWGTPDGDLNGDGSTDGADLGILLSEWE